MEPKVPQHSPENAPQILPNDTPGRSGGRLGEPWGPKDVPMSIWAPFCSQNVPLNKQNDLQNDPEMTPEMHTLVKNHRTLTHGHTILPTAFPCSTGAPRRLASATLTASHGTWNASGHGVSGSIAHAHTHAHANTVFELLSSPSLSTLSPAPKNPQGRLPTSFLSTLIRATIIREAHPNTTQTAKHIGGAAVITPCVLKKIRRPSWRRAC